MLLGTRDLELFFGDVVSGQSYSSLRNGKTLPERSI